MKLAAIVAPGLLVSLFLPSWMFVKGTTLFVGFGVFGQPTLDRGLTWLNHTYPHWQKLLEIRKYGPSPKSIDN